MIVCSRHKFMTTRSENTTWRIDVTEENTSEPRKLIVENIMHWKNEIVWKLKTSHQKK
jgi:hypothetical protein